MGIKAAQSQGLMPRCEMVWTTAGVTLPPIHPRCRCAIVYREVGGLAAGNINTTSTEGREPKLIERIKFEPTIIQKTLAKYEAQIVTAPVEHAIIILRTGEVWHCNGDLYGIPFSYFEKFGSKLEGAHVTHNHPQGAKENEHTFSDEDIDSFIYFKMACLHGIDEKFLYELNRNPLENEFIGHDLNALSGLAMEDYHYAIMLKALIEGLGYWRRER